jgi:TonB family protein
MLKRLTLLCVLPLALSTSAFAQNISDFWRTSDGVVQQALGKTAHSEWQGVRPAEFSCLDQNLRQRGANMDGLLSRSVLPADPQLPQLRSNCRRQLAQGPQPAAPQPALRKTMSDWEAWEAQVVDNLSRNKRYPADAVSRQEQGTVIVSFTVDRNGNLLDSQIKQSSGSGSLDREVLELLSRINRFPPLPSDYTKDTISLTIPIKFSLHKAPDQQPSATLTILSAPSPAPSPPTQSTAATASTPQPPSSQPGGQLSQTALEALRERIGQCWQPPAEIDLGSRPYAILRILFKPDGSLAGDPILVEASASPVGPAVAESGKRALLLCQPFTMLKPERYDLWKDIELKFDLAQLSSSGKSIERSEPHSDESEPAASACDTYAASEFDTQRKAPGIPFDKIDPSLAVPACESAVQQFPDDTRLIYQLGRAYQKANNFTSALAQYRKAAEHHFALAQTSLGAMYANGGGTTQDYQEAVIWYRKAAEQNLGLAQFNLGQMYVNGWGVSKNYQQALAWFRKAADQNLAAAQFNLGLIYESGNITAPDYQEALAWYQKAANQGHEEARMKLQELTDKIGGPALGNNATGMSGKTEEFGSHGILCQSIHCDEFPKSETPRCSHCDGILKDSIPSCSDLELQKKAAISFTNKYLVGLTTGITLATVNTPFRDVITESRSNDGLDCTATIIGSSTIFFNPNGKPAQGGTVRIRYTARKTDEGKLFVEAFDY